MKFSGKVGNGPMNEWLNFGGDKDHGSRIRIRVRGVTEISNVPAFVVKIIKWKTDKFVFKSHVQR